MSLEICNQSHDEVCFETEGGLPPGFECPVCHWMKKVEIADEQLAKLEYEITQLEGTIADLREKLTPEPR